jgi:ubiquinone/menaquinone biosynthesis C-methylase UbiE
MNRIENEKQHGIKISDNAEAVWNWESPAGKKRANRRAELLIKTGKITATSYALEIGCGTGLFTRKVFDATKCKIVAIDISDDLLKIAKEKLTVPAVDFRIGDAMNLDFPANTFDVVFGSSVLHHLDMEKAYTEMFRVLKPGGRIAFAEPNMLNPQILIQKNIPFIKKYLGDSPDETAIIRWKTKKELEKIGYSNVNIFPYDFLHPIVPSVLTSFVEAVGKGIEKIPLLKEIAGSVIIYAEKPTV